MSATEQAYEDIMYTFENSYGENVWPQDVKDLAAFSSDYVSELQEQLQERDSTIRRLEDLLGQAREFMGDINMCAYAAEDDATVAAVGAVCDALSEAREQDDSMERYHRDHHTGPVGMCWQDACAYVNDSHGLAFVQGRAS